MRGWHLNGKCNSHGSSSAFAIGQLASDVILKRDLLNGKIRPHPHESGDFCTRICQRISQQSMRVTKKSEPAMILAPNQRTQCENSPPFWKFSLGKDWSDTVTSSYRKNIWIRASTRIRRTRVDGWLYPHKQFTDTKSHVEEGNIVVAMIVDKIMDTGRPTERNGWIEGLFFQNVHNRGFS